MEYFSQLGMMRSVSAGALAAFSAPMLVGTNRIKMAESIPLVGGQNYSLRTYAFVIAAANTYIVDWINAGALGIHPDHSLKHLPSFAAHLLGGAFVMSYSPSLLANPPNAEEMTGLALTGAFSELGSQWLHQNFFSMAPPEDDGMYM